jgi:addiction module HigA family antidote
MSNPWIPITRTKHSTSRKTLSALLNGRFGISPEMAIRLSKAFGGSVESWLIQQTQYDLWQAMQKEDEIKVKSLA